MVTKRPILSLVLVVGWLPLLIMGLAAAAPLDLQVPPVPYDFHNVLPVIVASKSFSDDFSNPASGWPVGSTGTVEVGYVNGYYQMRLKQPATGAIILAPSHFTLGESYTIAADTHLVSGSDGLVGLVLDWTDRKHYTLLILDNRTQELTLKRIDKPGEGEVLVGPVESSVVRPFGSNHLQVTRQGSTQRVFVNGRLVGKDNNDYWRQGGIAAGFYFATRDRAPQIVRYDNFLMVSGAAGLGK